MVYLFVLKICLCLCVLRKGEEDRRWSGTDRGCEVLSVSGAMDSSLGPAKGC